MEFSLSLILFACVLILVQIHPGNITWLVPWLFDPTHFTMVTISFLSPPPFLPPPSRPHPRPLSFVWLAWIKVPMMHGATTSTVSSASTPVTNVPFAESAASNQVCSFISVLFYFSSVGSESCSVFIHQVKETPARNVTCVMFISHLSPLLCLKTGFILSGILK